MLNPFNQPELIKAEIFTELPEKYRDTKQTAWSNPNRQGAKVNGILFANMMVGQMG